MKEVWSNRYGKKPSEGLHQWLTRNIKGYRRENLQDYLTGFSAYLEQPAKADTPKLASNNFQKWTVFVKKIKDNQP